VSESTRAREGAERERAREGGREIEGEGEGEREGGGEKTDRERESGERAIPCCCAAAVGQHSAVTNACQL
jgi:hypothetical protein